MNRYSILAMLILLAMTLSLAQEQAVPERPFQLEAETEYEGATAIAVLKWRDMSDDELGFEILRSDNNKEFRVVGMVGANTPNYRDKIGKYITGAFSYKVRAFNESGKSEGSNIASVWF